MKTDVLNTLSRSINKAGFTLKKNSPTILVVAGVVGTVASAIMACRATLKLEEVLEETKEQSAQAHAVAESEEYADRYSEEDLRNDLVTIYAKSGIKIAKLYGPAIVVGAVSIASILYSHKILSKRNVALASAYAIVEKGFKEYRGRVVERFGEQIDKELRYNIKAQEIEETTIDENGNEVTNKVVKDVIDDTYGLEGYSEFARFFDRGNPYWEKDAEYNLHFLLNVQKWANDKLQKKGYLFLNEVYEALGLKESKAGQVVGWIYNEDNPIGDNYIDFGIHELHRKPNRDFVNGYEPTILLDFNVDGNIWNLM